jgi:hypothetical protein
MGAMRFRRAKGQENHVGAFQRSRNIMTAHFGQGGGAFLDI